MINPESGDLVQGITKCLRKGHSGHGIYTNHLGTTVIGVWKWFSYFEWIFLIEIDRDKAFAPIIKSLYLYFLIGGIFLIFAVIIAFSLSRNIDKSVSAFVDSFTRGASGDLSVEYPLPSIESKIIMEFKDNKYVDYDKARGMCFFEIGDFAGDMGRAISCRLLRERKVRSCRDCRIYKTVMKNELNELGAWFNMFMKNMKRVVGMIKRLVDSQLLSSREMSDTTIEFSENATDQASSTEEIMGTIEELFAGFDNVLRDSVDQNQSLRIMILRVTELSSIIDSIASEIKKTQMSTDDISHMAKQGGVKLNRMNEIMGRVYNSSTEMVKIINIIDDISEQINLLALNAAIEAARAGDTGRGFAVVADEISKLADQTASSVKEIDSLIKLNNEQINEGMSNVKDSVQTLSSIISGFNSISIMMSNISDFMKKQAEANAAINEEMKLIKDKSDEIKLTTNEHKGASDEILKSVSNIAELTQENAAGAEKIAANAEQVSGMARELADNIRFLKV